MHLFHETRSEPFTLLVSSILIFGRITATLPGSFSVLRSMLLYIVPLSSMRLYLTAALFLTKTDVEVSISNLGNTSKHKTCLSTGYRRMEVIVLRERLPALCISPFRAYHFLKPGFGFFHSSLAFHVSLNSYQRGITG